ncbi:Transcription repressor OFP15 [Linum perenne]
MMESVIRGLKSSERLFFSPGETSSVLLQEGKIREDCKEEGGDLLFSIKEGSNGGGAGAVAAVTLDSRDPFEDFKISMAEMVEAHGLRDWEVGVGASAAFGSGRENADSPSVLLNDVAIGVAAACLPVDAAAAVSPGAARLPPSMLLLPACLPPPCSPPPPVGAAAARLPTPVGVAAADFQVERQREQNRIVDSCWWVGIENRIRVYEG